MPTQPLTLTSIGSLFVAHRTACLIEPGLAGKPTKEIRAFRNMMADLVHFQE